MAKDKYQIYISAMWEMILGVILLGILLIVLVGHFKPRLEHYQRSIKTKEIREKMRQVEDPSSGKDSESTTKFKPKFSSWSSLAILYSQQFQQTVSSWKQRFQKEMWEKTQPVVSKILRS